MEAMVPDELDQNKVIDIANAMTKHSYSIGRLGMNGLFKKITAVDYVTLSRLFEKMNLNEDGRLYLSEVSHELDLPISRVSRLSRMLQDRGLVVWKHDGTGEEGTYIQITGSGIEALERQRQVLSEFYTSIIKKFGVERFLKLLSELEALEQIINNKED